MTKRKQQARRPIEPSAVPNLTRTLVALFVLDVVALLIGIAFFAISAGVQLIVRSSAPYWSPAHRVMDFLLGTPTTAPFAPRSINGRVALRLSVLLVFAVAMILFGFWMLLRGGWCAQNLFCAASL